MSTVGDSRNIPARPKDVLYKDVPNGAIFKALRPDIIGQRVVPNTGTFKKIGNSHSTEIHSNKDAIFDLKMPCKIISDQQRIRHARPKPKLKFNSEKKSFAARLSRIGRVVVVGGRS